MLIKTPVKCLQVCSSSESYYSCVYMHWELNGLMCINVMSGSFLLVAIVICR